MTEENPQIQVKSEAAVKTNRDPVAAVDDKRVIEDTPLSLMQNQNGEKMFNTCVLQSDYDSLGALRDTDESSFTGSGDNLVEYLDVRSCKDLVRDSGAQVYDQLDKCGEQNDGSDLLHYAGGLTEHGGIHKEQNVQLDGLCGNGSERKPVFKMQLLAPVDSFVTHNSKKDENDGIPREKTDSEEPMEIEGKLTVASRASLVQTELFIANNNSTCENCDDQVDGVYDQMDTESGTTEYDHDVDKNVFKDKCEVGDKGFQQMRRRGVDISSSSSETTDYESDSLKEHVLQKDLFVNTDEIPFRCEICQKMFKVKANLQRHMITHTNERLFKCDTCDKEFKSAGSLRIHLLIHTDEFPYRCKICGKGCKQISNLKTHMRSHTSERPYKCDTCGQDFKCKTDLVSNIESHVADLLECHHCHTYFKSKKCLAQHISNVHRGREHKCPHCNKSFKSKHHLRDHALVHSKEKPFECEICNKMFASKGYLKRHALLHSGEKPIKCNICNYASWEGGNLRRHVRIHISNTYSCQYCSKTFTNSTSCKTHVHFEHTNPEAKFQCDFCHMTCVSKNRFEDHMARHFPDRTNACDICGKLYKTKLDVKSHMATHWATKDKTCEICGRSFTGLTHLRRHVKRVHSKKRTSN